MEIDREMKVIYNGSISFARKSWGHLIPPRECVSTVMGGAVGNSSRYVQASPKHLALKKERKKHAEGGGGGSNF